MKDIFGIDFGTTNSAVVGKLRQNTTYYGDGMGRPFPSIIAVSKITGIVQAIGREAWQHRQELTESCEILSSTKMDLGTGKTWRIGPEIWTPERAVTEIFKGLINRVKERGSGAKLDAAVISIPVGFKLEKRQALRKAAHDAGLEIKGFVSEPTSALFKNYSEISQWSTVVVFDWGGGTLDISVVAIKGNLIEEIATLSNPIGGDVLDRILAEWAHNQVMKKTNMKPRPFDAMEAKFKDQMISQCEFAKRTMVDEDIAEISILRYGEYGTVNLILTIDEFSDLFQRKIDEAVKTLEECVENRANISFDQVGCIMMVGGSSNLRGLREYMDKKGWSCEIKFPADSEWYVADGAAILSSNFGQYISAQTIGIRLSDNTVYHVLKKGQSADKYNVTVTLGLIDNSDNVRLIFVDCKDEVPNGILNTDRVIGRLSVPAFGFTNEPIQLHGRIDQDLLLQITGRSMNKAACHERTWSYESVRFRYELPVEK